ncbi:MAG: hypothetical protein QM790_18985 [Nibricoccus sp.]
MLSSLHTITKPRWSTKALIISTLVAASGTFLAGRLLPANHAMLATRTLSRAQAPASPSSTIEKQLEQTWESTRLQAACPSRNRKLEEILERLARTDPHRALALAMDEPNWLLRDKLRDAALRGWGAVNPDAAADWSMAKTELGERMYCIAAVLSGAVEKPDDAVRVGLRVCAADPSPAGDYGHALINALIDKAGSYEAATRFALSANMVDRQSFLVDSAFYQWAQHQPETAAAELNRIDDPKLRSSVMKGLIEGWADADAKSLATYAQNMPPGEDRTRFMSIALAQWASKNPEDTMEWINQFDPHPDFDKGISSVALGPTLIRSKPETAMELTEYITDQAQRTLTRDNVFWRWALRDADGARKYAESIKDPDLRSSLLDDLTRLPKGN